MPRSRLPRLLALVSLVLAATSAGARAEDPIKIGLLLPFSGPFSDYGVQIGHGIDLFVKQHGDTVAGRKIEIIRRDVTGVAPDLAKRLARELVTRDKVDFLAGFGLTPNTLAVGPIGTEAKKPMVIMNAATSVITERSPYFVRFSFTLSQIVSPLGEWAAKNGMKRVYVAVADYAPGHEAEAAFTKAFTAAGGEIVGSVRIPVNNLEFAAYVQRIKDAAPQGVFLFVPSGEQPIAFMKSYIDLGLKDAGVALLGGTEIIDEAVIDTLGDKTLGVISAQNYSYAHTSAENREYVAAWNAAFGTRPRPNFMSVAGYDGMAAIYRVIDHLHGAIDPDKAMAAFKEIRLESPRGPIEIDPATRDIIETVYIRRVERVNGELVNREIFEFPSVKDPAHAAQ
jgi:branched-chain amino acid transport system substrate-binding protein